MNHYMQKENEYVLFGISPEQPELTKKESDSLF